MKMILILLFSLPLLAFEGKTLYECASMYSIISGSPHAFTKEEQGKSSFAFVFNEDLTRLKTSDGLIYQGIKTSFGGRSYLKQVVVEGKVINYKLKIANNSSLYKSVSVAGYGELANEYVVCVEAKKETL